MLPFSTSFIVDPPLASPRSSRNLKYGGHLSCRAHASALGGGTRNYILEKTLYGVENPIRRCFKNRSISLRTDQVLPLLVVCGLVCEENWWWSAHTFGSLFRFNLLDIMSRISTKRAQQLVAIARLTSKNHQWDPAPAKRADSNTSSPANLNCELSERVFISIE
jgi:hypothetical protein